MTTGVSAIFFASFFFYRSSTACLMIPGLRVLTTSIMYYLLGIESGMYLRTSSLFGCCMMLYQTLIALKSLYLLANKKGMRNDYGTSQTLYTWDQSNKNFFSWITSEIHFVVIFLSNGQQRRISLVRKSLITSLLGIFFRNSKGDMLISSPLLL